MITVSDLGLQYSGQPLFSHVDLQFVKGNCYGIIGANGAGKSTFLKILSGELEPTSGEVSILGKPMADWDESELTSRVGYIFQNPFTQISGVKDTVFEEIAIGLENLCMPKDEIIERVVNIVQLIGIEDLIELNPNELSGGQRQRVAFASILAMDCDIYVIDEPTSQLDPEGTEKVFQIIAALKKQKKSGCLPVPVGQHKLRQVLLPLV